MVAVTRKGQPSDVDSREVFGPPVFRGTPHLLPGVATVGNDGFGVGAEVDFRLDRAAWWLLLPRRYPLVFLID